MTTYYEVLGVTPDATSTQIKAAYLRLARTYHPDFHTTASAAVRSANERTMQSLNEAWSVLSDPVARRDYDHRLTRAATPFAGPRGRGPEPADERARRAEARRARAAADARERASWRPFDADDDFPPAVDDPAFDEFAGPPAAVSSVPKQVAVVLPTLLLLSGIVLIGLGLVINLLPVSALGLAAVVAAALGFLVLPLFALSASARNDRR